MNNNKHQKSAVHKIQYYGKTKELTHILGLDETTFLLYLIDEGPKQYSYLETTLKLSHTSVLRRLNTLQDLGILKKQPIRSKRRKTHVYDFTNRGAKLMTFIKEYEKEITLPLEQQKIIEIEKTKL
jgi:DNA-binding HxlR family transcriptional regulator